MRLDPEEKAVADAVVKHLAETGRWPHFRTVERRLVERFDVAAALRRLDPDVDTWRLLHDGTTQVRLGPEVLLQAEGTDEAFAPLVKAFPVIVDRYVRGDKPMVAYSDLLEAGFSEEEATRAGILIESVGRFKMSGTSGPARWSWDLGPEARALAGMRSARDYLVWWAARERDWRRQRQRQERRERRRRFVEAGWVRTAIASLVVGVLVALFTWWLNH